MKRIQILTTLFMLAWLISCNPTISEIAPSPDLLLSPTPTIQLLFTQPATASSTPQPLTSATPANAPFPVPTLSDEQVYIDPEGWYSVAFPASWRKSELMSYVGSDGFFETGYLSELGFVPNELTVCEWLANIPTKNLYTVSWAGKHGCQLLSRLDISPATTWEVIENPSADFSHRYLFIKADNDHFIRIQNTFTWLRPVDEARKPDFQKFKLRPEDVEFWNNTFSLPSTISLEEYALPSEHQGEDPSKTIFLDFIPPKALPTPSSSRGTYTSTTLESVNQSLAKYDYELQQQEDITYLYDLYQNGELVLQNIFQLPDIYSFQVDNGEKLIFFAHTLVDSKLSPYTEGNVVSYVVQDHEISVWEKAVLNPMYSEWKPIWVENKPLFLGLGEGVTLHVWNVQHEPIFSFATYDVTQVPIKQFRSWENHWILEVSNFVVQDGEIINEKYNFEEVFNWSLINDKPFYFFRKGPRSGFSYDGQFFSTYYQEIIHGFCCGLALNNPRMRDNTLRFFGKRDGVWYYVVLEIR
ncbi:MAG: hypothetical protein GYA20_01985 [Chloroflexi bacterium]|nr:hypothetical protein [Chloroflexota bacterium]